MTTYDFSEQDLKQLDQINTLYTSQTAKPDIVASKLNMQPFWEYLKTCEDYHTSKTFLTTGYTHDMENMLALYVINDLIDKKYLTTVIRDYGLPPTSITENPFAEDGILNHFVAEDGTLYFISKYCQLDVMWTAVLVYYAWYKHIHPRGVHPFIAQTKMPPQLDYPKQARVAILGDWGTGDWDDKGQDCCPAQLVIDGINSLKPDYIVHLGDVYYAGTSNEEREHLLGLLKNTKKAKLYTMNSNHEMYDGANGLFKVALNNPKFVEQKGSSYFAFEIGNWVLVGLDSAYYDDSELYMSGSLYNDRGGQQQITFLKTIKALNKPILLMTHHNGIGIKDHKFNINTKLFNQVVKALDGQLPDMWYWGHVHNGLVYNTDALKDVSKLEIPQSTTQQTPRLRCCGHASMPFGNGSGFYTEEGDKQVMREELLYYSHTPLEAKHPTLSQKERVLNGFAILDINGSEVVETFYEVSNTYNGQPKAVWTSSSSQ
ncbi:metallophosphoesterase [Olleya sp. YS]|uniref:metallophosphoesterase family protein n=1 Tax=Olleya sp. YS TaxID=3028318 RepID=UPI0024342E29|nr:metallophosphoesterase [Olleya sp. YS]WGD34297.1 metallophosphoesterase [Olleya sp. YS]